MAGPHYLGAERPGDIRRDDELPLLVYSFHTAFSEAGLVRIPRAQVNSHLQSRFAVNMRTSKVPYQCHELV
jgi:hypothetical protein